MEHRDVGNEVIVALAVIGMLALALTFGVVLTLSRSVATPDASVTAAAASDSTENSVGNATQNATEAVTAASATENNTSQSTVAATTETITPTKSTEVVTSAATVEVAVIASNTPSDTPTKTPTKVPTTAATFTKTNTPTLVPSKTDTATLTFTPSATFTKTLTNTPPATQTPSFTPAQLDAGILPTATQPLNVTSGVPSNLPTVQISTGCKPRSGWNNYVIQQGDTLFGIARQAGVSLTELQQANCISNPSAIFFGQVISVPPGSIIATTTPAANATASTITSNGNAGLCPNPDVRITSPISGAAVSGIITFSGTAGGSDFSAFRVEYTSDLSDAGWIQTARSDSPVLNGYLGRLDPNPSQLPAGGYSVRLVVETKSGNIPPPCVIRLTLAK